MSSAAPAVAQTAWTPPLGIPNPPFGITQTAPPAPNPWNVSTPGFYYVDASSPSATDSANPMGSAILPRRTVPLSLLAGSVVEIHGTYSTPHSSPAVITASGTAASPVFIRGVSPTAKPIITKTWAIKGSYLILENLEFAFQDPVLGALAFRGGDHVVLRHSDVHGNLSGGGVSIVGGDTSSATNFLIYDDVIHDNGDVNAVFDQDVHGIVVGSRVNNLWVVDSQLYGNSGDGIQINAGAANQATTHHIYVGRNVAHHNKQTGFWSKQAVDVIFSENLSYAHRPSNSSYGAGMGFQYAPERVWFLFNHIHDCDIGIGGSSDNGLGFGQSSFFIGNVIHNIHTTGTFAGTTAWSSAAIMLAGGVQRHVLNNTIDDVDGGINSPARTGALHIVDNIISNVTQPQGSHAFLEMESVAVASTMYNNLLEGAVRIKWASNQIRDLAGFQAAFPGQGVACLNADPEFVDPFNEDFHLQATSPAVDAGVIPQVYATFLSLYGIDISEAADGTPRPGGLAFDLGAYEVTGNTTSAISIDDVGVTEGNNGTVSAVFTVSLSSPSTRAVTANYATAEGTTTAGTDIAAGSGTLTFPPGATTLSVVVAVKGDTVVEPDETFFVDLSGATGASITDGQGRGTIINDDLPSLAITNASVSEGNSGTVNAVLTVTLSAAASGPVTVSFATANGTALGGTDYVTASGTVIFAPGSTSQTITVLINGDTLAEPNETFFVNLANPINATVKVGKAQGTILNDDGSTRAILLTPAPGSTFTSSAVTFTWSSGSGVTEYWLGVGTTSGGGQIYSASQGTRLSRTVFGLPTNGSTVYVRLRSRIAGLWQYKDYVYKAASP